MSLEASLKTHLQAASAMSALVGDRIYPVLRPENSTVPAVTYQVIAMDQVSHLGGRADSLRQVRVQVDCWARKHSEMLSLESAVRARMDTAAADFRAVLLPGGLDDYEPETKFYRRMLEFSIWFTET